MSMETCEEPFKVIAMMLAGPQPLLNDLWMGAIGEHERRRTVPEVVEPKARQVVARGGPREPVAHGLLPPFLVSTQSKKR